MKNPEEKALEFKEFFKEVGKCVEIVDKYTGQELEHMEVVLFEGRLKKLFDRMGAGECPKVEWKTINGFKRGYLGKMFLGEFESLGNGSEFYRMQYPHEWAFAGPEGIAAHKIEEYARNIWTKLHKQGE